MSSFWEKYLDTLERRFLDWAASVPCKDHTKELYAAQEKQQLAVIEKYCNICPHQYDCLVYSLANEETAGVWGGVTEHERRVLIKTVYDLDARPSRLAKNIELIAQKKVSKGNDAEAVAGA